MARGSGFGALGKNFIIVGNAQHRIFGSRFGYLIRATTSFFCTLTPVPRVVKEGPRFHFLAPLQGGVGRSAKRIRPDTKLLTTLCRPKPMPTESQSDFGEWPEARASA